MGMCQSVICCVANEYKIKTFILAMEIQIFPIENIVYINNATVYGNNKDSETFSHFGCNNNCVHFFSALEWRAFYFSLDKCV